MLASAGTAGAVPGRASVMTGDTALGASTIAVDPPWMDAARSAIVRILVAAADPRKSGGGAGSWTVTGLGFLVDGRGYVLTQSDVVRNATVLETALVDGRRFAVKQVWLDDLAGVAVLKIEGRGLPALPLGESGSLRVGDAAIVIGWPAGSKATTSTAIRATGSSTGDNLAIDAAIGPEHAGGPLVNARGQVVGVASTDVHGADGGVPGGFAIPIDRAKKMLRQAQTSTAQVRSAPTSSPR